ncbi:MAG: glucose-1-phosphate cytidylyltransferase [bacterium]|nr:glucose-1-phosphate cytidylyltransferase [bacterium]
MKVGILAGGVGSRLSEETITKPKPMVEVGGKPILWHIMKLYAAQGFSDFAIALGYKGEYIKKYMVDYASLNSNLTVRVGSGEVSTENAEPLDDWTVQLIDTGQDTGTGGRIKKLVPYMGGETFMMTWGDGVADIDLRALLAFHKKHGKLATVTTVRPPARFGLIEMEGDRVVRFTEKPQLGEGWINGAFFVLEPGVADYVDDDATMWEKAPMERLAADGELIAYRHEGFWQCMDTLRHKKILEDLWDSGNPPWKKW